MFQINCLNPISKVGLDRLTAAYKVIDNMNDAEGVLVRSASMHEMDLPENFIETGKPETIQIQVEGKCKISKFMFA